MFGADLPLLAEIVTNTLHTMIELEKQSRDWSDELDGIKDRIDRIRTISELVQPSNWDKWKNPQEALRRLQSIYYMMPKEYRSEKSVVIEDELSKAMNMVGRINSEAATTFSSGKELERRGADASPGVAEKLTASGVGTLVALQSQSTIIESHITSLLTQMLADANERENREVVAKGTAYGNLASSLNQADFRFSSVVLGSGGDR
jgi:phage anti-repressor protein